MVLGVADAADRHRPIVAPSGKQTAKFLQGFRDTCKPRSRLQSISFTLRDLKTIASGPW